MRISIVGPSGSGKTYLAKKLGEKYSLEHINLDYVFFKHVKDKSREAIPEDIWRSNLQEIIKKDNWIIEGVNPITEVFDNVDLIIFLKPSVTTALYRQWKRYFTDPVQRKEHGFINNLKLSRYLFRQYLGTEDRAKNDDPMYSRVTKVDRILRK